MLVVHTHLFARGEQPDNALRPLPLASGLIERKVYWAVGMFNRWETSDACFIVSNDVDEVKFICSRNLRSVCLAAENEVLRMPLKTLASGLGLNGNGIHTH